MLNALELHFYSSASDVKSFLVVSCLWAVFAVFDPQPAHLSWHVNYVVSY